VVALSIILFVLLLALRAKERQGMRRAARNGSGTGSSG
jgi:hypothetical protein